MLPVQMYVIYCVVHRPSLILDVARRLETFKLTDHFKSVQPRSGMFCDWFWNIIITVKVEATSTVLFTGVRRV